MKQKTFVLLISYVFLVVGLVQLIRILLLVPVRVGNLLIEIPYWASIIAMMIALYLSFVGFRLARKTKN
ncbi:hypothetical protein J4217_02420 [Candidatus Pacearchaeota archaeon]|nr:hypothetical protein [Candidatus Pacearchaeota archaeon]